MIRVSNTIYYKLFHISQLVGGKIDILFMRRDLSNDSVEEIVLSHQTHDAISGFVSILKQRYRPQDLIFSNVERRNEPGVIGKLRSLLARPECNANGRKFLPDPQSRHSDSRHFFHLEKSETEAIKSKAREQKATLNSYVLYHLNQCLLSYQNTMAIDYWMLPVSLYEKIDLDRDNGNRTTFINVGIPLNDTPGALHQRIKQKLSENQHWQTFMVLYILALLPMSLAIKVVAHHLSTSCRLGVFSNIGSWQVLNADQEVWGFCPPISNGHLMSCGMLTFNERLSLIFRTSQPGVLNKTEMEKIEADLRKRLLS